MVLKVIALVSFYSLNVEKSASALPMAFGSGPAVPPPITGGRLPFLVVDDDPPSPIAVIPDVEST
jgi:hypothetical protein